ncbi:hypothetical protein A9996_02065 [Gelidibacter algens]|nr:hypothetical protein A9996_02065 [Gelidibacter algens]
MFSCDVSESWARTFTLSDFGISNNDKFVINSGQVALYNALGGSSLRFDIYKIDSNFPTSSSITHLIGSSQIVPIPIIGATPEIINVVFDIPVVVPEGTQQILVQVRKLFDINTMDTAIAYIAGTEEDTDMSWYWGCHVVYNHTPTVALDPPVNDANFFINVTGELRTTADLGAPTLLTHNVCDDVIKVNQYSCKWGGLKYARTFVLDDFGVSNNEEFIIDRGQVAFASVGVYDVKIQFNIYKIDANFPSSYSNADLIGSSQIIGVPYFGSARPQVFEIIFGTPIVIPPDVDRILVEVNSAGLAFIAGGAQSSDVSWIRSENGGCPPFQEYKAVTNPNINFFINVTGRTNHVTNNFEMNISNNCSEFLKEFRVENSANVASVLWDFGDPASGTDNNSTDISPFHDFSADGSHTITATITSKDGSIVVISKTIDVKEPPNAYGINNVYACETVYNTGISSSFDLSTVTQQVLGGQTNKVVTFVDGRGQKYTTLPMPFTNSVKNKETITVRVAHANNTCCYSETTFDVIVNPLPKLSPIPNFTNCETNSNGFANFDLSTVENIVLGGQTGMSVTYFDGDGNQLQSPLPNPYVNQIPNEEIITVRVTNDATECYNETKFTLFVNEQPMANPLDTLVGCDTNADGFSEYFDTSTIESQVVGSQTGMAVTYFDASGNTLPNPLPNPFTNTEAYTQQITVRVTTQQTECYAETLLNLETATQPHINQPDNLYACDAGDGFAYFNTSSVASTLLGAQSGLEVFYSDGEGNSLPSPLPTSLLNTMAYSQTINVRVENRLNRLCYSETSFDLIVNRLPEINLEAAYFICNLEPSMNLAVNPNFLSYEWISQDGALISSTPNAEIVNEGTYLLTVTQVENGIICENTFSFDLIRSVLPQIEQVNYGQLGANFIEIIASGDGHFAYSTDGINYQDSNYFSNVQGGIYTVYVRDKDGCGEDSRNVIIVDYPRFFTPNNDGYHDYWHIKGITAFPNATIMIFDRYGKLLSQLASNDVGWNGLYNGNPLIANDYWFTADLGNGTHFSGHFTLKR